MIKNRRELFSLHWTCASFAGLAFLAGCASTAVDTPKPTGWIKDEVADSYVFGYPLNREINKSLLQLETLLVMVNVMTAWLLLSGDQFYRMDFRELIEGHRAAQADIIPHST